jgi:hypothetical protein
LWGRSAGRFSSNTQNRPLKHPGADSREAPTRTISPLELCVHQLHCKLPGALWKFLSPAIVLFLAAMPLETRARPEESFTVSHLEDTTALSASFAPTTGSTEGARDNATQKSTPKAASPASGRYISAPWKAKTHSNSRLRLQNELADIRADAQTHFELTRTGTEPTPGTSPSVALPAQSPVVGSALKAHTARTPPLSRTCASVLLHQGALSITKKQAPGKPTVLLAKTLHSQCMISAAKVSLSCDAWGNTRICVYEGEIHVRPFFGGAFILRAGQTARIESALPPTRGLLSDSPEALEQRRIFDALINAQPNLGKPLEGDFSSAPKTSAPQAADAVGSGALVPFDLKARRQSVLSQPASPDLTPPNDVSPELPLPN